MIRRLFLIPAIATMVLGTGQAVKAQDNFGTPIAQSLPALSQPPAPPTNPDAIVEPPHPQSTFPMRPDGQADMVWNDNNVNLTDWLSRYYYDPRWRGEVWAPFQTYWFVERGCRMMATWPEYDQFSELRVFNKWHKFWEKYSGYGP